MERQEQVATREEAAPAFRLDLGPESPVVQPHPIRTAWPQPPERGEKLPEPVFPAAAGASCKRERCECYWRAPHPARSKALVQLR